jgi:hypothetical protein
MSPFARVVLLSLTPTLLLACGDGEVCEAIEAYPVDVPQRCYEPAVPAAEMRTCREETSKGVAFFCLVSSENVLHVATRNASAHVDGSTWRAGDELSAGEAQTCDTILEELGPPGGENRCN